MKQNLRYSLLMLLLAVFNLGVFADNTFTFEQTSKTAGTLTGAPAGVSYTFVNTGTNANDQLTANNSMTLTISGLTPTYTLTGLTLELRNNASKGRGTVTVSQGYAILGTYTVTGLGNSYQEIDIDIIPTSDEGNIVVLIEASENSVWCDKFIFSYTETQSQSGVAAPTLPANQDFVGSMEVEITNNDNDATVYYTTNGDDPDANSTEYTESFTITETTTVKAIAIKGNDASDVVTRTYTKTKPDIATITGISPTTVNEGDAGTFTLAATFAEGTEAGEDYEVTWTSDDEDVLMVEDGEYLALAAGTANVTVSVTVLDDSKYYEVSETFTVTVKEPGQELVYELVTDASTLADGDNIIIAYVNTDDEVYCAMGGQANNNRPATGDVTYNTDGTLTIGEDVQQITLEGDAGGYYFNVGDGYLYASSSTANQMKTEQEPDDNAKATIEIDANGDATIVFKGSNTRNHLRFNLNLNNGNPIFSCYAETSSVQTLPQIYRLKSDVETVTITIGERGYASYCGDKNLDFSATELKAYAVTQVENGVMILTEFKDGYKAGEGAVLKGAEGTYQVPVATTEPAAVNGNMLIGNNSDADITVDADGTTYRFGYSPAAQKVGFMKATSNFTVAPGKAYLKINITNNAPAFLSFDGTATGIDAANVSTTAADGQRYNLNGQRVNSNYRGVVIVDGKKLIQK